MLSGPRSSALLAQFWPQNLRTAAPMRTPLLLNLMFLTSVPAISYSKGLAEKNKGFNSETWDFLISGGFAKLISTNLFLVNAVPRWHTEK